MTMDKRFHKDQPSDNRIVDHKYLQNFTSEASLEDYAVEQHQEELYSGFCH